MSAGLIVKCQVGLEGGFGKTRRVKTRRYTVSSQFEPVLNPFGTRSFVAHAR
jgi:hypothetical protein